MGENLSKHGIAVSVIGLSDLQLRVPITRGWLSPGADRSPAELVLLHQLMRNAPNSGRPEAAVWQEAALRKRGVGSAADPLPFEPGRKLNG
jgi:hypothetical protein